MANNDVVLFVEDEPLVRESMIPELEDAGFEVVTAENGDEASCILRQMGRIDFLLTDIRMPGPDQRLGSSRNGKRPTSDDAGNLHERVCAPARF
jgi:CheY-like chemotaxis protein